MDTNKQLYEQEVTEWRAGVYEDIKRTFRAPIVNWYFRTLMANEPEFTRLLWSQIKPLFQTRGFGQFTVSYRDAILSEIDADHSLPRYRPTEVDLRPAEWRELTGQLSTFDIVAPRLALVFPLCDHLLNGESLGSGSDANAATTESTPALDRQSTAPLPAWVDRDRGTPVTMVDEADCSADLMATIDEIREFHGFDDEFPSIYRCLAQWPSYLDTAWRDLEPIVESASFDRGRQATDALLDDYLAGLPYTPQLTPTALAEQGFEESTISDLQGFAATFNGDSLKTVIQAVVIYAATINATGERSL
jgi:hypothetical protein